MALHEKVQFYHSLGFNQDEILQYLSELNNVVISKRTLKRVLSSAHLYRRKHYSDLLEVALFLEGKLETADKLHGYKLMHLQCIQSGYTVTQETVRLLLQIIDPQGVQLRRRGRLRRRIYSNPGPDFMWHIDSYDKLKPYGICINGCIDGFSRHIIWLEAYSTNSDPAVIASYFMSAVESRVGCPKRIRADMGTENGHVENMHKFLRYEDVDEFAQRCFLYGSSNHNQRIEAWWSYLRSHHAQFWISFFHEMKEEDQFCGNFLDKNLAQFCFMQLIQDELQEVVHLWNTHRMRQSPHQVSPSGRPLTMYRLPHLYNAEHHLCQVSLEKIRVCKEECSFKGPCPCDRFELCCLLMAENNLQPPVNSDTAKRLYNALRNNILQSL
ncbi:uncharacterized protein [Magallana gigas]|uniref:uncharacterized protein n=1 Tax=Magallana gigas TaxID=29159 RepID=UPI0033406B97